MDNQHKLQILLILGMPDVHTRKSYKDNRRFFDIKLDEQIIESPHKGVCQIRVLTKIGSTLVVKKMFDNVVDSTFTYIVGEDVATLKVGFQSSSIKVDFTSENYLPIYDNSSKL